MNKKLILVILAIVMVAAMVMPSYAETIWEKRQKVMQGDDAETKTETPEPAVQEEENIPGAYDEEEAEIEPAIEEDMDMAGTADEIDPYEIYIPEEYGTIIESSRGTNGKLIIHIQDAHANYEAQMNLANILESLINNYDLSLILQEGRDSDSNLSDLRKKGSSETRKVAAEKLLKNDDISGEDYLDLTSDYPMTFQGIEDMSLYNKNKDALWEMDKFKDLALEYVNKMILACDALKPKIYSEALLKIDRAKKDYDNETIDLVAYYEDLSRIAADKNIPLDDFRNFSAVIKINDLEKKVDLVKINDGTATDEQKNLYTEYKDMLANLNVNKLFKEEPLVENAVQAALFENDDQKKLYRTSKALSILDKMLRVKVVPEEYGYFLENKSDFDPRSWTAFLKDKSESLNTSIDTPANYYIISDNIDKIENFYAIAGKREDAFLKKSRERMDKDGVRIAALIAGGFHTPTLTKLLADSGYSYVVISPRVTTETDEALYRSALQKR
ncbi:MAG: hypothetical protein WC569_03800 [Candidatus Omnitrophota bacterium]